MSQVSRNHAGLLKIVQVVLLGGIAFAGHPDAAEASGTRTKAAQAAAPYVVRSDLGGSVQRRIQDIQALHASGRQVEILGERCLSSCTMLLGLSTSCVNPRTTFGFHGASRNGNALPVPVFDSVSKVIAQHYPPQLRSWYMEVARYSIKDLHFLTGAELIALGAARPCSPHAQPAHTGHSPA